MSPFPPDVRLVIFDADGTLRRNTVPGRVCPYGPGEWEPMPGLREAATGVRPEPGAARFCPHAVDAGCRCRKPEPGLLLDAMAHHGAGPGATLFVGDAPVDREAARRAGVRFLDVAILLGPARPGLPGGGSWP